LSALRLAFTEMAQMATGRKDDLNLALEQYEKVYQVKCVDVEGKQFEVFGYVLIGASTIIMALQAFGIGPADMWKRADDVTTVLFTIELLVRIAEKGYLFFMESERHWNFFDSVVVAISLFSMIVAANASADAAAGGGHGGGNSAGMNKMKMLRTLRLLRLCRLCRIFKGIANVNKVVDIGLQTVGVLFLVLVVITSFLALFVTMAVAFWAGGKAWLKNNSLPQMPSVE